jgi:hypothetical protein
MSILQLIKARYLSDIGGGTYRLEPHLEIVGSGPGIENIGSDDPYPRLILQRSVTVAFR